MHGVRDVCVQDVPDPDILDARDAIVRFTRTAICGSDLHLFDGFMPTLRRRDVLGHELVGAVVEVGNGVRSLAPGDRAVVPFPSTRLRTATRGFGTRRTPTPARRWCSRLDPLMCAENEDAADGYG